jgi:two-component system sensor histidine kinase/response regulator
LIKPVRRSELLQTILRILAGRPSASQQVPTRRDDDIQLRANDHHRSPLSPLHVLVAEDNMINQRYAVSVLEKEGYSTVVVNNGREALAALERESFDLMLMDLHMPEMDGFEATSSIRARERFTGRRMPIVAVTAHAMSGDREKCLAAGMDAHVSKPIRRAELIQVIASLATRGNVSSPRLKQPA